MPDTLDQPLVDEQREIFSQEVVCCPECGSPAIKVPVLKCAHCGQKIPLRAFWRKAHDGYIAECIDLNLVSQGQTPQEAVGKLQEAMFSYLDVVFDGGPTKGLVYRLSPLLNRIRYHIHKGYYRLRSLITGQHRHLVPNKSNADDHRLCHC
jgi:predicted RNase H-like HicB family nuclease